MKRNPRIHGFTLIEMVVSIAILSLSIGVLYRMIAESRARIAKNAEKWAAMHRLTQAAEYVLLHESTVESVPYRFFPYDDCDASISYDEAQGLPDDLNNIDGQLPLEACTIEIISREDGTTLESVVVDRIIYETGLEEE